MRVRSTPPPILIMPMVGRDFSRDGTLKDNLQPYADAMKRFASEKHVPVIRPLFGSRYSI
jgi:hypothetical protein